MRVGKKFLVQRELEISIRLCETIGRELDSDEEKEREREREKNENGGTRANECCPDLDRNDGSTVRWFDDDDDGNPGSPSCEVRSRELQGLRMTDRTKAQQMHAGHGVLHGPRLGFPSSEVLPRSRPRQAVLRLGTSFQTKRLYMGKATHEGGSEILDLDSQNFISICTSKYPPRSSTKERIRKQAERGAARRGINLRVRCGNNNVLTPKKRQDGCIVHGQASGCYIKRGRGSLSLEMDGLWASQVSQLSRGSWSSLSRAPGPAGSHNSHSWQGVRRCHLCWTHC
mmetsp:Transcript_3606/g.8394  ORF Transcript_3606/g.8394 Transcript_3606/m.8394 type:complete len:285 (+) Transcript_3606:170-1024(+)